MIEGMTTLDRRAFLQSSGATLAAASLPSSLTSQDKAETNAPHRGRIFKSIKFGMFRGKLPIADKFQALKDLGYDGVELNSPGGCDKKAARAASAKVGLPIHGVVDSIHWKLRLSDPSAEVREKGLQGLLTAIRDSHAVGGSSVLLVPGRVTKKESQQQVWDRSIQQIRKALPTASKLGIHVLIENVWNGFCYDAKGPDNQSAAKLAEYLDAIDSPWVGSYFDIGNHQRFGKPAEWIETLGKRIVKLDVKDWAKKGGFCKIGDGDVDWAAVRKSLTKIGFTGWCTAEVRGGDRKRIEEVAQRMNQALGL